MSSPKIISFMRHVLEYSEFQLSLQQPTPIGYEKIHNLAHKYLEENGDEGGYVKTICEIARFKYVSGSRARDGYEAIRDTAFKYLKERNDNDGKSGKPSKERAQS